MVTVVVGQRRNALTKLTAMAEEAVVVRATLIKKVITTQSLNGDGYVDPSVRGLEVDCFPVPCYSNDGAAMCARCGIQSKEAVRSSISMLKRS